MNSANRSPNSLAPAATFPQVVKARKTIIYMVLLAVGAMAAVLVYSINFAHGPEEQELTTRQVVIDETEKPLLLTDSRGGLALEPPKEAVVVPPIPAPEKKEPLIVVRDNVSPYSQEIENIRRQKAQAQLSALSAPLLVKKVSSGGADSIQQSTPFERTAPGGANPTASDNYDVAADKDKENFFTRSSSHDSQWISPHSRQAGQELELKTGTVVPGVMVTGINSDLPGNLIAQVSQNVFDSARGDHVLIPQGARLYGVYDSRVIYGQERVLIAWNRIIFPDGSSMTLGAMPGADMAGYSGFNDRTNNHYFRIFGSAVLMSLISGGTAYAMDSLNSNGNSGGNSDSVSMQDEMVSAMAAQLGQATTTLLQKNLNIKPTLEIRPGYQFNIVLTKDLVFQEPYQFMNGGRL